MADGDNIWDEISDVYKWWGISAIPFTEKATALSLKEISNVFTGRKDELRQVLGLFRGRERQRLLVYGWYGIGKTAFILEVLGVLQRKAADTLTAYISLPRTAEDLATSALIALARAIQHEDEQARLLLHNLGLLTDKPLRVRKGKVEGGIGPLKGSVEDEALPAATLQYPSLVFEDLLARARQRYQRVVIAIDDLDKHDPAHVRDLLRNDQGLLAGGAWFILTGHPFGLTRDFVTTELGLFDLALQLPKLDQETSYRMLVNYLNSVRPPEAQYEVDDARAVYPFTPETAHLLCARADGVPRWLNRLGSYVLRQAEQLGAERITPDVLERGLRYADEQLRGTAGLNQQEKSLLRLLQEKGMLSDATVSLDDLRTIQHDTFSELMPILERLIELDLVQRLPNERANEYAISPLLLPDTETDAPPAEESSGDS